MNGSKYKVLGTTDCPVCDCCGKTNLTRAVAPLQAEIERLQAEVERLKSMTSVTMGIGRGDGNLFVHGDYESIKAAQSLVFRAEGMKKALKDIRSLSSINSAVSSNPFTPTAVLAEIHRIADAAMSKEGKQ
jgi:hypothetical protein